MRSVRAHRLPGAHRADRTNVARRAPASDLPWGFASQVDAGGRLDLGARIALAADLQGTAGNAATGQLLGLARTDQRKRPPDGAREIMEAGSGGQRGLTRTSYVANPPIFRVARVEQTGGSWSTRPNTVRLPSLDHEVFYPAPGRHRLRALGESASQYLDVTDEWSGRLLQGEEEHVGDIDRAWQMTWGRVAEVINGMAAGEPITGPTQDAARTAAWHEFRCRLPAPLRPAGDTPTTEAQEAQWGAENDGTIFRKLMRESRRARDFSNWHTPDQTLKQMEGEDRIDEMAVGRSNIGGVGSEQLIGEAWDRLTGG